MAEKEADVASYERVANDMYVYGSVSLALALAKETNMIQCLCTAHSPLSSVEIAQQLKLKERYVREVLNSVTVAGLVQLEAGTGGEGGREARYWVPPPCRQALRKAGVNCLSISTSARHFAGVRRCMDLEGPDCLDNPDDSESYDAMDEWAVTHVDCITEGVLQTPGLRALLEKGVKVVEVGCGTGRLSLHLAAMFPSSTFTLTDLEPEPLDQVKTRAQALGLTNVSFRVLDVLHLPGDLQGAVDWLLMSNVIHCLPRPSDALQAIRKALKPGGHFSLVDFFVSSDLAENVRSCQGAAVLHSMEAFNCIPASSGDACEAEASEPWWSAQKAQQLVQAVGMQVLGVARSQAMNATAVIMCQKAENSEQSQK